MTSDFVGQDPDDFIGKVVTEGAVADKIVNDESDAKRVYIKRFEPGSWQEGAEFNDAGAVAYELYVICSDKDVIQEVNHRIEQCHCSHRSFAPHGAPNFIFPVGAMFDLEWDDIAGVAQNRMLEALTGMVKAKVAKAKKAPKKQPRRTVPSRKGKK